MDSKKRIIEVLDKTHLMSLGTSDTGGVWVADVIFIHDDDLKIYWMSDPNTRHSKSIEKDNRVAGTITVSNKVGEDNFGVQVEGIAEKIEGPRHDLAVKHFLKRNRSAPREGDDILEGDSWYVLNPIKIELIDERNLGFEKFVLKV